MREVVVTGPFDDLRSHQMRFLHEASKQGPVCVLLWSDALIRAVRNVAPRFPEAERLYFLRAVRFVRECFLTEEPFPPDTLPEVPGFRPSVWAVEETEDAHQKRDYCRSRGMEYEVVSRAQLTGFPIPDPIPDVLEPPRPRVLVTGCFDWLHSGHVRFFEEASQFGDLTVVVGHDANIRLLKGAGHPLLPQDERRYMVSAIRYVKSALISSGDGWMDSAPQISLVRPDIYLVNEDGDNAEKRDYCRDHGIRYVTLSRQPKEGLPKRQSRDLRGF